MNNPRPPFKPSRPIGFPQTPFDPQSGRFLPQHDDGLFAEFTVVEVGFDTLVVTDRDGRTGLILKPWTLRRSSWEGETFGGATYSVVQESGSDVVDARTATVGANSIEERVRIPYAVGEKLMCYRRVDRDAAMGVVISGEFATAIPAGSHRLFWEDLNTAGRRFENRSYGLLAQIDSEDSGTYEWSLIYGDGPASGEAEELNGSTGIVAGTIVVLHQANGQYWFFFPVEECS